MVPAVIFETIPDGRNDVSGYLVFGIGESYDKTDGKLWLVETRCELYIVNIPIP